MNWMTVGRVVKIVFLFGCGVYQIGMGFFYVSSAKQFLSDRELYATVSSVYGTISGGWSIGGVITCFLASVLLQQELRLRQLERTVERLSSQAQPPEQPSV